MVEVFCHPNIGLESYVKTMVLNFRFQGIQHRSANGVPYSNAVCNQELIVNGAIVRFTEETECDRTFNLYNLVSSVFANLAR